MPSKTLTVIFLLLLFLLPSSAQETPEISTPPAATLSPSQAIDLTATQLIAKYDATATAYPVSEEQVDAYGAFVFVLAFGSLLIVFVPLLFGVWWMNRGK